MWVGIVLGVLAFSVWSRPAAACGACFCENEPRPLLYLGRDLPLNLALPLRVLSEAEPPPRFQRGFEGPDPLVKVERAGDGSPYWWLTTEQDLEPNSEYRIVRDTLVEAQFSTGAARDTEPPTLAGVSSTPGGNADLCDTTVGAQLKLEGANDGQAFNVWVEVELDVDGTAHTLFADYANGEIRLGHSAMGSMGCLGPNELPELTEDASYPTRVRLHDAAGNVSEWQSLSLGVAADAPSGCGVPLPNAGTGGASSGGAANTSGGSSANTSGDAGEPAQTDAPSRNSKGCGCSLGQRQHGAWSGAALLAFMLTLAGARHVLKPKSFS